jgi:crossover junction endodeoxyribonuclease RuvC
MPVYEDHKGKHHVDEGAVILTIMKLVGDKAPADVVGIIEHVSAAPGQGVSSAFNFGKTYGTLRTALKACEVPFRTVTPAEWKRALKLPGLDKSASLEMARELWPEATCFSRAKDHNRAEAALLAYYVYSLGASKLMRAITAH